MESTPKQFAEQYIKNNAGPALYTEYTRHCQKTNGPGTVEYLEFLKIMLQTLSVIR